MKKLFLLLTALVAIAISAAAQNRTFHGTVLSAADDEPLIGATVTPLGGGHPVATDVDGHFAITVPASVKEIKVTYVGMQPKTVTLTEGLKIFLEYSTNVLDQVVVTGYGSGKKLGSVVGSVSVVGDKVFENTPSANFVDALQGQVPGLAINSSSGDPSSNSNSIVLRGRNGLNTDSSPLFICDGAPIDQSLFMSMNPADIESVTVLKDAASIAIYGSRGANGIIVITTKRGKYGAQAKATFRASYGWSSMVKDNVDMMDSKQYMQFRDMIGQPLSGSVKNLINTYNINTDWRSELFSNSAPTYNVEGQVSGGSENLSYYLSLNHYSQEGIIENSSLRRTTMSFNIDSKVNSWFRVGLNGNLSFRRSKANLEDKAESGELYTENPMLLARMGLPFDSPYSYTFNDNGDIVYGNRVEKLHYSGITLPWYRYTYDHFHRDRLAGSMRIYEQITPIPGLVIKAQQALEGYDATASETIDPRKTFYTAMGDKIGQNDPGYINPGSNSESFSRYYQFTYTNTAEYTFDFLKNHHARVLIGQESIIRKSNGFGVATSGTVDKRMNLLNQGTTVSMGGVDYSKSEIVINSYFANANYDYDNRYFIDASFRRDGSSQLAPGHRWGNFWAFGLMWNLRNESWLNLQEKTWLNDLRLHYSYGGSGNSNIGNFAWMGAIGTYEYGYGGNSATGTSGASNYDLSWETVWSHDLGVNVRFFDRIGITADWYKKTTSNMLYNIPYAISTGVESGAANVCKMTNTGIEAEITGDIFKSKDWYIGARVSFNYNRNRITELWDGTDIYPISATGLVLKVGDVSNQYYMVRYVGVDPADGKQMWLDKNDNVTKTFPSDAQVCTGKSSFAPWTGGFGATARWKGLSASVNFAWQSGKWMINNDRYFTSNPGEFGLSYNQTADMLNMWTTPGQVTDVPAFGEKLTYAGDDTRWLEDASFCRLKNLTVAYDFPTTLVNKWGLSGLQLHFTGRNLWTITNFSGYDPEPLSNMVQFQFPNTRQFEFGLEVSF